MPTDITPPALVEPVTLRTELKPGDIGWVVYTHGMVYSREQGFDHTFEAYVAGPLAELVCHFSSRNQIWIAEQGKRVVGCIAIVEASPQTAQLRWFLVEPTARGNGLGKKLLQEAIAFGKRCDYESIVLWTVSQLTTAAHLYLSAGFKKIEEIPGRHWGVDGIEEKYVLTLN